MCLTWWGHWDKAPSPPGQGERVGDGEKAWDGARVCPLLSAAAPQQLRPSFGCGSEFAGSFPGRKAVCDQGQARQAGPSGTFRRAGSVLGVTATCHPLGSPVPLGMERPTGEEVQDPGAGTRACSIPMLLGWHFPASTLDSSTKPDHSTVGKLRHS